MIHVDVKKLGRIPPGGGWRAHDRSEAVRGRGNGYDSSTPPSTTTPAWPTPRLYPTNATRPCAAFLHHTLTWLAAYGVTVCRVLADSAMTYRPGPRLG